MRILHNWLQRYIKFTIPPERLAERLGMLGLEVAGIERMGARYAGFVVGQVVEKSKHPNADKLTLCRVNVGKEVVQIVCGAANVEANQKVAVGLPGATVPRNQHDPAGKPFVLSHAKIRGVESHGMICSEYELDLGKHADGILVLDPGAKIGQPLVEYLDLNDIAYEIEITPNRPDWLSHIGVAREIGTLIGREPTLPRVRLKESKIAIRKYLSVIVKDRQGCNRFAARMIRGVKIGPSPRWLQNALRNADLRPRNNVVDVTNYVMLECGQPLHAFDYALLKGSRIVVRKAIGGTSFTTLDGKEHTLPDGAVMVCDAEREVSIAGIMGGLNSEINDATSDVVLESANWKPSSIRQTSKALGISTDASQRFERGADPEGVRFAIDRATQLILETAGGRVLKGVIDVRSRKNTQRSVPLRAQRVNDVLGTSLRAAEIVSLLRLLGIRPGKRSQRGIAFKIPSYRIDIEREIDLIEEVARVYGYDKIEERRTATVSLNQVFLRQERAEGIRSAIVGLGFQEAISYPLQERRLARLPGRVPVGVLSSRSQETSYLRTSLLPGLLQAVARNANFGNTTVRIFEIGHVFSVDEGPKHKIVENFLEEERACLVLTGVATPNHWSEKPRLCDIFDAKGVVQTLMEKIALDKSRFIYYSTSNPLAENAIAIENNGSYAGCLGKVKAEVLKTLEIEQDVFFAEVDLTALGFPGAKRHTALSRFPRVKRDVAFIVDVNTPSEKLDQLMREASTALLLSVELFDVYQGERLPDGKKSLAFTLDLMSMERTLTDSEIDAEVNAIVRHVEQGAGAVLRSE